MSNATKEYFSEFFCFKMDVLLVAVIFTFTLRHKVAMAEEGRVAPLKVKLVGLASIVLWATVAITARLIGLLSSRRHGHPSWTQSNGFSGPSSCSALECSR